VRRSFVVLFVVLCLFHVERGDVMQLECPNTVLTDPVTGALLCQDGAGGSVAWLVTPSFDISQIDPATGTSFMAWGFFTMAMGWAIGFGIKQAVKFLRSV
jgi:hypothetical protein